MQRIRGWSDKKKRNFSILLAVVLTLLIVFLWHTFDRSERVWASSILSAL